GGIRGRRRRRDDRRRGIGAGDEGDVDPVVGSLVGRAWIAARADGVDAIPAVDATRLGGVQGRVVIAHIEVAVRRRVAPGGGVIRRDVGGVGGNRDRRGEGRLLPARGGFAGERDRAKVCAIGG